MAIRPPSPNFSKTDKELLRLLSQIILDNFDGREDNRDCLKFALTDNQAEELLKLLEHVIQEEKFFRKLAFVNQIVDSSPLDEKLDLRLVRLTGKRPIGAGIGMTSENMRKWRVRLGVASKKQPNDPPPMTFTHFLKMEEKLLNDMDVDLRISQLVLQVASQNEDAFLSLLRAINGDLGKHASGPKVVRLNDLKKKFIAPLTDRHLRELPKERIIGLFTVVSNTSVLFTTRDWGVAGTISTMCGGFSMIV